MFIFHILNLYLFIILPVKSIELHEDHVDAGEPQPNFNFWPLQNAKGFKISKRDAPSGSVGQSEGGQIAPSDAQKNIDTKAQLNQNEIQPPASQKAQDAKNMVVAAITPNVENSTKKNETTKTDTQNEEDPPKQGVVERGLIVFGGFALLAVAYYFIFYRKRNKNNENSNIHNVPESLQFRYGVLQTNERDNLELSRVPLTMESDEDDDDDLEIFDLEQKKRNISYSNLRTQDNEPFRTVSDSSLVFDDDRENLLLDIDDKNTDTLINLTGHSSKSML